MKEYGDLADRLREVQGRVGRAAERAGRSPGDVGILAVTKFHPVEALEAAYRAGMRLFGENRVQEAEGKYPAFLASHPEAAVHMIGHLQGNKVKRALEVFSCVQSVDSTELLAELEKRAGAAGRALDILLELRTGEDSKSGFPGREEVLEACSLLAGMGSLRLRGLMTMAPYTSDLAAVRASFRSLRSLFEEIAASRAFPGFEILSMGMSEDYEIAVEEGATLLRLGTALFGRREEV